MFFSLLGNGDCLFLVWVVVSWPLSLWENGSHLFLEEVGITSFFAERGGVAFVFVLA